MNVQTNTTHWQSNVFPVQSAPGTISLGVLSEFKWTQSYCTQSHPGADPVYLRSLNERQTKSTVVLSLSDSTRLLIELHPTIKPPEPKTICQKESLIDRISEHFPILTELAYQHKS